MRNGTPRAKDISGQRFGRLTVLEQAPKIDAFARWRCKCDCSNETVVRGQHLRSGNVSSCGCLAKETAATAMAMRGRSLATHGEASYGKRSSEYVIWAGMLKRCRNPNSPAFNDYGGRGVKVCDRWLSYENFLMDMCRRPSTKHSIDRIDHNGDYEPSNCRWATDIEQNNNRRNTRYISYKGETLTIGEVARRLGVKYDTIKRRLELGWSVEETIERPLRQSQR